MTALAARLLAGGARLLTGAALRGEPVDAADLRPRIWFANHASHLDFAVLWAALPESLRERTRPVAAADYWSRGRLRPWLARELFRAVLVERGSETPEEREAQIARMLAALDEGSSLILFPEGTRGTGLEIAPFRSGLWHLASRRPGVLLVPVGLENLNRILPKGEFLPAPLIASVTVGAPVVLRPGETKEDFLARSREAVRELLAR
jgi:1-acyl-sn-glycerol-3-phosphate acyltransferase